METVVSVRLRFVRRCDPWYRMVGKQPHWSLHLRRQCVLCPLFLFLPPDCTCTCSPPALHHESQMRAQTPRVSPKILSEPERHTLSSCSDNVIFFHGEASKAGHLPFSQNFLRLPVNGFGVCFACMFLWIFYNLRVFFEDNGTGLFEILLFFSDVPWRKWNYFCLYVKRMLFIPELIQLQLFPYIQFVVGNNNLLQKYSFSYCVDTIRRPLSRSSSCARWIVHLLDMVTSVNW